MKSYDGPVDWDKKIDEHRKEIEREKERAVEAQEKFEQEKDSCYELQNLCREFLEENSKDWARLKEKRINEKNRILRLEQAGILSRKAKIKALEKNIEIGLSKIPAKDREKLRQEKSRKEEAEMKAAKEDLWSLRGREKKVVEKETSKNIQELKRTTEQIVEILQRERTRKLQEKERKDQQEKNKANRKEMKRLREKKVKELQEKWAMYRWVNEFIAENKLDWERTRKIREQERNEKILEWEKKSRLEKIKTLREKFWKKQDEKKAMEKEKKTPDKKRQECTSWREKSNQDSPPPPPTPYPPEIHFPEISLPPPNPGPSTQLEPDKKLPQDQEGPITSLAPIFKKLKSPVKLKKQEIKNPETSSTGVRTEKKLKQSRITDLVKTTEPVLRTSNTNTVQKQPVQKQTSTKTKSTKKVKNKNEEKKNIEEKKMKGFWKNYAQKCKEQREKKISSDDHAHSQADQPSIVIHDQNLIAEISLAQNEDPGICLGQVKKYSNYKQDKSET